jgi:hypothetical protein
VEVLCFQVFAEAEAGLVVGGESEKFEWIGKNHLALSVE